MLIIWPPKQQIYSHSTRATLEIKTHNCKRNHGQYWTSEISIVTHFFPKFFLSQIKRNTPSKCSMSQVMALHHNTTTVCATHLKKGFSDTRPITSMKSVCVTAQIMFAGSYAAYLLFTPRAPKTEAEVNLPRTFATVPLSSGSRN